MDLTTVAGIGKAFEWFATLGRSELRQVRSDADELLGDLRKSLVNLWDLATEVTRPEPGELTAQTFQPIYDYFTRFYLDPANISAARTHCGYVDRDIERLTFKLGTLLHADIGRWSEAKAHLSDVISNDRWLVESYDRSIAEIQAHLQGIDQAFKAGNEDKARAAYADMRRALKPDILELQKVVAAMDRANRHLWSVAG